MKLTHFLAAGVLSACAADSSTPTQFDDPVDSGTPDMTPPLPDPELAPRRIFVTSTKTSGDLQTAGAGIDGLDGGDRLCAAAAESASLGGSWTAYLSSDTVSAIDRLADGGPWYLLDGVTLVFESKAAIPSTPLSAVAFDETGTRISGAVSVWTGTAKDGSPRFTCGNWTSNLSDDNGSFGVAVDTGQTWTSLGQAPCALTDKRLYCFEK
jgi:hypothetical protein